ncbi:MAG: phosphotransferase [Chloroflexi bacterium]|nr:phosphotransferase [Chloroflexota bacterium]
MNAQKLRKIAEGREAEIFEWEDGTVLRLFRHARTAESVDREAAAMEAGRSALPLVPAVLGRAEVDGRPGLIMERIDGPDLISLMSKRPWMMRRVGSISGTLHAQLHDIVAPASLLSLKDGVRNALSQSTLAPPEIAAAALRELETLPDGDRLCHGDFHPGNILMSRHGPVVIDWPNVSRGDPHADLARALLLLRAGELPPGSPLLARLFVSIARNIVRGGYESAYRRHRTVDADLLRRWMFVNIAFRFEEAIPGERPVLLKLAQEVGSS